MKKYLLCFNIITLERHLVNVIISVFHLLRTLSLYKNQKMWIHLFGSFYDKYYNQPAEGDLSLKLPGNKNNFIFMFFFFSERSSFCFCFPGLGVRSLRKESGDRAV